MKTKSVARLIAAAAKAGASQALMEKLINAATEEHSSEDESSCDGDSVAGDAGSLIPDPGPVFRPVKPKPVLRPRELFDAPTSKFVYKDFNVAKIAVPKIKRDKADAAKNFLFLFNNVLKRFHLHDHAYWGTGYSDEDDALSQLVLAAVENDAEILTDLRTHFGEMGTSGFGTFAHVRVSFIDPLVNELSDAEREVSAWSWATVFTGDGRQVLSKLNEFFALISRLSATRRGDAKHWIEEITKHMPTDVHSEFHRTLVAKGPEHAHHALTSIEIFSRALSEAVNSLKRRKPSLYISLAQTTNPIKEKSKEEKEREKGEASAKRAQAKFGTDKCTLCGLYVCPHAKDKSAKCDVKGNPTSDRRDKIKGKYRSLVDATRKKLNLPPLDQLSSHELGQGPTPLEASQKTAEAQPAAAQSTGDDMDTINAQLDMLNGSINSHTWAFELDYTLSS